MSIPDLSPLWISGKVSLCATLIAVSLGTISAYRMYQFRAKGSCSRLQNLLISIVESISIVPLVLPPTVIGFILLILWGKNGWLGQILAQWNSRIVFTWYAAVLAAVIIAFPLIYRAALGAFGQIDKLLLDAARIEGASETEVFWYDAASVASVGKQKAPDSPVAGRATVFIFPDLNTGNTTYKAVQRSANVVSVGPMLQGLRKPVNDLSRGALVDDIVYTIALTAIQAASSS